MVSDVVCPWCFIGTRRLSQALASLPDVNANVELHPFLLGPSTPEEGADLRQRLQAKYGLQPDSMFGRVEAAARSIGIPLDFAKVRRTVQTLKAHTLLRAAIAKGTQLALSDALFDAYFLQGKDVSDQEILSTLAQAHGFTDDEVRSLLASPEALTQTRTEARAASEAGIQGVTFFVFNGRVTLSGAESVERFRQSIQEALR